MPLSLPEPLRRPRSAVRTRALRAPSLPRLDRGRRPIATATRGDRSWTAALWLLFAATMLIRARYFGNPFIHVDEQFYLLMGDRMLHGATPYVDIWDRKPIGLFLIYAAIRSLGGAGIVQYQLVAAIAAGATAVVIAIIARRISAPGPALLAGIAYGLALLWNGGAGGQSPVFYNLPMALAGLILIDLARRGGGAAQRAAGPAEIKRDGMVAMLLVGIALQIKYSALFEGCYFGLALIGLSWRAAPRRPALALDALCWIAAALAPTALAFAYYAANGQADSFLYANFVSILARRSDPAAEAIHDLLRDLERIAPFLIAAAAGAWRLRRHPPAGFRFALGWLFAATAGFAIFGSFYNHYALPLLVPLAITSAAGFAIAERGIGRILAASLLAILAVAYPITAANLERRDGGAAYAAQLAGIVAAHLHGRCPYIFYGEPILYHLTDACLPTRWAFPFHLNLTREAAALGVDPIAEARRIMDRRPPVVVDRLSEDHQINKAVQQLVRGRLARDYRLIFSHVNQASHPETDQVWILKPERGGSSAGADR